MKAIGRAVLQISTLYPPTHLNLCSIFFLSFSLEKPFLLLSEVNLSTCTLDPIFPSYSKLLFQQFLPLSLLLLFFCTISFLSAYKYAIIFPIFKKLQFPYQLLLLFFCSLLQKKILKELSDSSTFLPEPIQSGFQKPYPSSRIALLMIINGLLVAKLQLSYILIILLEGFDPFGLFPFLPL